jgi:membrane protein implicated in regulation of membrane protease activity
MTDAPDKRPYVLLRAIVTMWLLLWGAMIALFLKNQFSAQPLFNWPIGLTWLGLSLLGWWAGFRFLRRLRATDEK